MCWKTILSWFHKPDPIVDPTLPPDPNKPIRTALLFGINDYPSSGNDLRGCLNDIDDVAKLLDEKFPGFTVKKFKDSQATIGTFKSECEKAIALLKEGDTVIIKFDSCFSESVTRDPIKGRFLDPGLPPRWTTGSKIFRSVNMKWLAWSGCGEHQTSADAYINGRFNGAFTFYDLRSITPGDTYRNEYEKLRGYLPNDNYEQIPSVEGPDYLLDKKIFEGNTLLIYYSGHGSYTYDTHGDESDGKDEVICLYNGNLVDDDINVILQRIP